MNMEKSGLSQQILEYYYKFGQNRDLEKYLRLRRNCHKSSSEGSINTSEYHGNHTKNLVTSKSLDSLTSHKNRTDELAGNEKKLVFLDTDGNEKVKVRISSTKDASKDCRQTKSIKMDDVRKQDKESKSIYSVSCESNISINLPLPVIDNPFPNRSDNQPVISTDNSKLEDTKLDQSNCSSNDNDLLKSPSTSAKMEKRLEWDSLGDVGYNKPSGRRRRKNTITSLEKSVLKEFFANQGIEINFPVHEEIGLFVIQKKSEIEKSQETPNAVREKWREVLHTVKEKYKEESAVKISSQSNQNSFVRAIPKTHSTPKEKTSEKCIQTSFIHPSENKEVQVNITKKNSSTLSTTEGDSAVSPSSFEFLAAPRQIKYSEGSDKENHIPAQSLVSGSNNNENDQHSNTNSSQSQSTSGVNLGVKLLCSLIEAKSLTHKQKKLLAKKIIAKITKKNIISSNGSTSSTMPPISTSNRSTNKGANSSSVQTLKTTSSSSMKSKDVINENSVNKKHKNGNQLANDDEEVPKSAKSDEEDIRKTPSYQVEIEKKATAKKPSLPLKSVPEFDKNNLLENWLGNVTKSEIKYAQRKMTEKQGSVEIDTNASGDSSAVNKKPSRIIEYLDLERKNHINWIENEIKHLENLKKLLTKDQKASGDYFAPLQPQVTIAYPVHKVLNSNIYDKVASSGRSREKDPRIAVASDRKVDLKKIESEVEMRNEKEKYSRKVKRTTDEIFYERVDASTIGDAEKVGNHLKITTYTVDEEKRFPKKDYKIDKSDKDKKGNRSKLETPHTSTEHQSPESNHYSELISVDESRKKYKTGVETQYATSASPSNFSSVSISLPMVQSSSAATTTTHRYDRQVGIGVQTSDSLLRCDPIFGPPNAHPTIREYRSNKNKQTQVKPSAVAYIINFERSKSSKQNASNDPNLHFYTLRDYLQKQRPDFGERVSERQKILGELKSLRQERQRKIEKILENATSESSVSRKLSLLPPPPTKYIRIFGTKEMKAMTKKHYRKLPEVLARKETESRERQKRNSRILANVFNKRLQGRVHGGKLSLEHSRTVI